MFIESVCIYVTVSNICSPFSVASKTTSPVKESHGRGNFTSAASNAMSPTRKKNMGMYVCMYVCAYFYSIMYVCSYVCMRIDVRSAHRL